MRKIDLRFLMGDFCSPVKDQVLLHALCNMKSVPYKPNFGGISAASLSPNVVKLASECGLTVSSTGDFGTGSANVRYIASELLKSGAIVESKLEDEISRLMTTVYSDPGYVDSMGPFL